MLTDKWAQTHQFSQRGPGGKRVASVRLLDGRQELWRVHRPHQSPEFLRILLGEVVQGAVLTARVATQINHAYIRREGRLLHQGAEELGKGVVAARDHVEEGSLGNPAHQPVDLGQSNQSAPALGAIDRVHWLQGVASAMLAKLLKDFVQDLVGEAQNASGLLHLSVL